MREREVIRIVEDHDDDHVDDDDDDDDVDHDDDQDDLANAISLYTNYSIFSEYGILFVFF